MNRIAIVTVVSYTLLSSVAHSQNRKPFSNGDSELLGNEVPNFKAKTLSGKDFNLKENRGKIILLNFWSLSCAACFKEIPELNKLAKEFRDKGFILVSVMDNKREKVLEQIQSREGNYKLKRRTFNNDSVNYVIIPDGKQIMEKYFSELSYPKNFILDRDGKLRQYTNGYLELFSDSGYVEDGNYKNLKAGIEKLINEPK
jgi:thiol-disulfide isomerase/thioredoxin